MGKCRTRHSPMNKVHRDWLTLDKTHGKNVASIGSQKGQFRSLISPKQLEMVQFGRNKCFLIFFAKKQWFLFEISTIIVEWSTVNTVRFNF